jgi:hypothetical protein
MKGQLINAYLSAIRWLLALVLVKAGCKTICSGVSTGRQTQSVK